MTNPPPRPLVERSVVCPSLVGRDAALTAGFHALDRARQGQGRALLVSGEAGIGKSRFLRAMGERARDAGFLAMQGACFEADRAHPYAPLLDLVRTFAGRTSPALAAHAFAPAGAELATLFPELRALFPDDAARPALHPDEERRRLFHAFTDAVGTLGRTQPLLLVFEDVHWSDDATLDLLLHLARRIAAEPVSLVLTFRSDEIGPRLARLLAEFDRARCASEVELRPLAAGDVATMLQSIFGQQVAFGSPFVAALYRLTEGNPFFIEETLKALVVGGDLEVTDGVWRARPLEQVVVPRTATEAVSRRLASLSEPACRVAAIAAVAGRRFDFALLQALTDHAESELLALVKELVAAQLVVEESADQFAFRHALTREAIRLRLLARERMPLHRAIAAVLERQREAGGHEDDDALAYHTFEAGDWEAARRHALRAAAHAMALGAPREALQHYDRAVAATTQAGGVADAALLVDRGRAHEILGLFPRALDDFVAALEAARRDGDTRAEWMALHALGLLWAARDYERAGQYRREALDVARAAGDPALIARSLNRVGNWLVNREEPHAAIPYHDEALALLEHAADARGVAETVDLLAMAYHIGGEEARAIEHYERAIAAFAALDHRRGVANALAVLQVCGPSHHASAGPVGDSPHLAECMQHERAARLTTEIGWRAGEAFSRALLADGLAWRGEFARALRLVRESRAIGEELEHLEWQAGARRVQGFIAMDLGDLGSAVAEFGAAHDFARRLNSVTWMRWTGAGAAMALARAGRPDDARRVLDALEATLPLAAGADTPMALARTLGERHLVLARAELALADGDAERALALVSADDAAGVPSLALLRAHALVALRAWDAALSSLAVAHDGAVAQGAVALRWRIEATRGSVLLAARRRAEGRQAHDAARALAEELALGIDDHALLGAFRAQVDRLAPPAVPRTAMQAAKAAHGGLTRRERDTAALIARGLSNRMVATTLGIGERTVEGYVASALQKLDFASRAQLAVWAVEQGLATSDDGEGRRA